MKKVLIFVITISFTFANDMSDIESLINKQWKANSDKKLEGVCFHITLRWYNEWRL